MLQLTLFGGFSLAGADGAEIPLRSLKAKALLAYLACSPRMSRSREEIMALLWSDRGEARARASLRQALVRLRKDLGEAAVTALIVTNDTVGLDPDNVTIGAASPGEELLAGFHLHDPAFEGWLRDERLRGEDATEPNLQPSGLPPSDKPSIAVLPFSNLSDDQAQEYFADGITGDIITALTRFRSLVVIARKSSFYYKGQTPKIQDVGRDLDVTYVLEGSVRKAGNRIRITVQLIEVDTGYHIWAERYDRKLEDVFVLQDEVTGMIVSTLTGRLAEIGRQRALDKRSKDLAVYDYLLIGDQCLNQGEREDVLQARSLYEKAIKQDPGSARAQAGLARAYMAELNSDWTTEPEEAGNRAMSFARKAVALDDFDSHAHIVLSDAHLFARSNFEEAEIEIEKALELNPNWYEPLCRKAWILALTGRANEGIVCAHQASRLNPFAAYDCRVGHFIAAYSAQRYEEALSALRSISAPGDQIKALLAACHAQLGSDSEARQALTEFLSTAHEEIAAFPGEDPELWRQYWTRHFPFKNAKDLDHLLDGLRMAGLSV
jgi:TolB-like protein/Tfp pilus assembly protein PilF